MSSPDFAADGDLRRVIALERGEAIRLLAGVAYGRVVFSRDALPAIRPVNHLVEQDGRIVIRMQPANRPTALIRPLQQIVVAYEADDIDSVLHIGWSVVVTGLARTVTDSVRVARYEQLLRPWADETPAAVVEIEPTIVSGVRLVDDAQPVGV